MPPGIPDEGFPGEAARCHAPLFPVRWKAYPATSIIREAS